MTTILVTGGQVLLVVILFTFLLKDTKINIINMDKLTSAGNWIH